MADLGIRTLGLLMLFKEDDQPEDSALVLSDRFQKEFRVFRWFCCFGALLAFPPEYGLSDLVNRWMPEIRVPSRAGVFVQFGLLMMAGVVLAEMWSRATRKYGELSVLRSLQASKSKGLSIRARGFMLVPILIPVWLIAEYPPFLNNVPVAPMFKSFSQMVGKSPLKSCGTRHPFSLRLRPELSFTILPNIATNAGFRLFLLCRLPGHSRDHRADQEGS